ncbi:MAG: hypothetical protein B1H13_04360 [Desulfobacteraceae bacterium 4484_190.3]|nr:MAG: hypothetical protein B1H13_04360 [Desulfobacteraceae bacterium 4484_190.3]
MSDLRDRLKITPDRLEEINRFLLDPQNELINELIRIVEKYGGPDEINRKAAEARKLHNLKGRLKEMHSPYLADIEWLEDQRDKKAFVSISEYRKKVLGEKANSTQFRKETAVTLEISALQFFPWLIVQAKRALERRQLMPGVAAAMQIVGASYVDTLDTKGTDGSNVHLGMSTWADRKPLPATSGAWGNPTIIP